MLGDWVGGWVSPTETCDDIAEGVRSVLRCCNKCTWFMKSLDRKVSSSTSDVSNCADDLPVLTFFSLISAFMCYF